MKAAVLTDGGCLEVVDIGQPVRDGWVLVAVRAAGICGSELHLIDGLQRPPKYPLTLGHEIAGIVAEAPPQCTLREGDRVVVYNLVACRTCSWCTSGREQLCTAPTGQIGFSLDGGFADFVRVPEENLIPIPDSVSFETAAVLGCSGMTALHAARITEVKFDTDAVVNGVGGVGLMLIQALAARGVRPIAVADSQRKADLARAMGAVEVITLTDREDYAALPERVRGVTNGEGAGYYFDLIGTESTISAGLRSLSRSGCCVLIGYTTENFTIHPLELITSELRVVSSVAGTREDLRASIRLASAGKLIVPIHERYALCDIETALAELRERRVEGRNVLVW